jgi:hypothetical protein
MFDAAVYLAEKAQKMGSKEWGPAPKIILALMKNLSRQYGGASRHTDAEQVVRTALDLLESHFTTSSLTPVEREEHMISLQSELSEHIMDRSDHATREQLHRSQLASGLVDDWTAQGINIRHNLAHSLFHQDKLEEASLINGALLKFADTEAGAVVVTKRLYLIMLNLRCQIMRAIAGKAENRIEDNWENSMIPIREELLRIHKLVFEESFTVLGIEDIDTWKAANNITGCLGTFGMMSECYPFLSIILTAGIAAKMRCEGKFNVTMSQLTSTANQCLDTLERSRMCDKSKIEDFRRLVQEWMKSSGCTLATHSHTAVNGEGVYLQSKGAFEEAEQQHVRSIELCVQAGIPVPGLYLYNLMLAIARQGRLDEAEMFRQEYVAEIAPEEAMYGALPQRMERSAQDQRIYEQAQILLRQGKITKDGEWWRARELQLNRAENIYGVIDVQPVVVATKEISRMISRRIFKIH